MPRAPRIPYKEMDPPIVTVCRAFNAYPGLHTVSSCGGHEKGGVLPADQWEVALQVELDEGHRPTLRGWVSIEFIAWVLRDFARSGDGRELELTAESAPPFLNRPANTLTFWVWGRRPSTLPDDVAQHLDYCRRELYVPASRIGAWYEEE
jgi:hypothetical protein